MDKADPDKVSGCQNQQSDFSLEIFYELHGGEV